jgi:alkylation response protein AidB-like acyl-CoA dehydrogenase
MFEQLFTDEDKELIKRAQDFASEHINEDSVSRWYAEGGIPDSVMRAYRDCGLGFLGLPEEYGGQKASCLARMAVAEELSCAAGTTLPFIIQMYSFSALSVLTDGEQMRELVGQFNETGRLCYSIAISDSLSGSNIMDSQTTVFKRNGNLYLSGRKAFVTEGEHAPYIVVLAKDMTECENRLQAPLSLWLVPAYSKGVQVFPINKIGQKAMSSAAITFENCPVQPEWRLGDRNFSRGTLEKVIEFGRCVICADSLGLARAAAQDAAIYARHHKIREKRLGDYGQIAVMLTSMQSTLFNMRSHVYRAALALDKGGPAVMETSLMKYYVPASAVEVANQAMQIFGGVGYTDASRVGRIWADCRGNQFAIGTEQVMATRVAKQLLDEQGKED